MLKFHKKEEGKRKQKQKDEERKERKQGKQERRWEKQGEKGKGWNGWYTGEEEESVYKEMKVHGLLPGRKYIFEPCWQ